MRYSSPRDVVGYVGNARSACGPLGPNNAFYCPADRTIYYDVNFLGRILRTEGDFAVVTVLAHEWGHHLQGLYGRASGGLTIRRELQADCLAGAYASFAASSGVLDPGDLEEGVWSLYRSGDPAGVPWFDPQAHGNSQQRAGAFQTGLEYGVGSC